MAVCALDFLGPGNRFVNIIGIGNDLGNEGMDEIQARSIKIIRVIIQTRSIVIENYKTSKF